MGRPVRRGIGGPGDATGARRRRRALLGLALGLVATTGAAAAPACAGFTEPPPATAVRVVLVSGAAPGAPTASGGRALRLRTDRGYDVSLTEARVNVASIELVTCEADGRDAGTARGLGARLRQALALARRLAGPSPARAHTTGSPTKLGVPHVVDLTSPAEVEAGVLEPPAVGFCSVRLVLSPADGDAVGLPDAGFVGLTARVAGTVDGAPLAGASDGTVTVWPSLDVPLVLDAARREATVRVVLGDGRLLDGLDLPAATDRQVGFAVMLGVEAGARVEVSR
jgi:hypothetical protein